MLIVTNNVEASVEFADTVSSAPLAHLSHICPFVEMRVEALHAGQRRDAVISPDRVHIALMKINTIKPVTLMNKRNRSHLVTRVVIRYICILLPFGYSSDTLLDYFKIVPLRTCTFCKASLNQFVLQRKPYK